MPEYYDIIIVGAGISGIGAAYRMREAFPNKSIRILEARSAMGGTWDLFKYPGIRSDSDMFTMGFSFNPWSGASSLADGPSILQYIKDTATKYGIDALISYNHKVSEASWKDSEKKWTLNVAATEDTREHHVQCGFLLMCSGYYNYAKGHEPVFRGKEEFKGKIIHPQQWKQDIDFQNKNVVVIGSGATAVTLVPALAEKAKKVTLLQRTPSYIFSIPHVSKLASILMKLLPARLAYLILRCKNILIGFGFYMFSKQWPGRAKKMLMKKIQKVVGKEFDMKHFDPPYNPWDQRLCIVPDADIFKAIKNGKVEMVTDTINKFTTEGVLLSSGLELNADLIITATGLEIQLLGGMKLYVNGQEIESGKLHCYRGVMFSDVPNFAVTIGYINASWTLKCDLNCRYVVKLIKHMDKNGIKVCTPRFNSDFFPSEELLDLSSGFIRRASDVLPKQGRRHPWKVYQNYFRDSFALATDSVAHPALEFRS